MADGLVKVQLNDSVCFAPQEAVSSSRVLADAREHCTDILTLPGVAAGDFQRWCDDPHAQAQPQLQCGQAWRLVEVR